MQPRHREQMHQTGRTKRVKGVRLDARAVGEEEGEQERLGVRLGDIVRDGPPHLPLHAQRDAVEEPPRGSEKHNGRLILDAKRGMDALPAQVGPIVHLCRVASRRWRLQPARHTDAVPEAEERVHRRRLAGQEQRYLHTAVDPTGGLASRGRVRLGDEPEAPPRGGRDVVDGGPERDGVAVVAFPVGVRGRLGEVGDVAGRKVPLGRIPHGPGAERSGERGGYEDEGA